MAVPTSTQLSNATKLKMTFGIGVPVPPNTYANYVTIDNISDYSPYLSSGTVKTLVWIKNTVGQTIYKSAGYDAADFTTPEYPDNDPSSQKELLNATNGYPVEGVYQFLLKIQFSDGGSNIFVVEKTITSVALCLADEPTGELELTYSCSAATFTSRDTTDYGSSKYTLLTLVRAHTVYPPDAIAPAQSPTTLDADVVTVSSLWSGVTYEAKLLTTVTYRKIVDTDETHFIFYVTTLAEQVVTCDDALCKLYCLLKKIRDAYYLIVDKDPTAEKRMKWQLDMGELEYFLATEARRGCGDEDVHVAKFYVVTGLDPDCDCGCDDTSSSGGAAPVTASGDSPGAQGPAGPQGPQGATGPTGAAGADGSSNYIAIVNSTTQVSTTAAAKAAPETLFSTSITPASAPVTLITAGSIFRAKASFTFVTNKTSTGKFVFLRVGVYSILHFLDSTVGIPNPTITLQIEFHRRATAATNYAHFTVTHPGGTYTVTAPTTVLDFSAAVAVSAQAQINDATADDNEIRLEGVLIEKNKPS